MIERISINLTISGQHVAIEPGDDPALVTVTINGDAPYSSATIEGTVDNRYEAAVFAKDVFGAIDPDHEPSVLDTETVKHLLIAVSSHHG